MKTQRLTFTAMFIAMGVLLGNLIYIPIGAAKCFPIQHAINVIGAVILGPVYSTLCAFCISFIRNAMGTGSILAYPGSMVGAIIAALVYKYTKEIAGAAFGEVIGTGIIGGLIAAPLSRIVLGTEVGALFYIVPFIISSIGGAIIGCLLLKSGILIKQSKKIES